MSEYETVAEAQIEELEATNTSLKQVVENQHETILSLQNELAILKDLHGDACQGWSKYQQLSEKYIADLRFIYGISDGALGLYLKRNQLEAMLKMVRHSACKHLPELDEIPY